LHESKELLLSSSRGTSGLPRPASLPVSEPPPIHPSDRNRDAGFSSSDPRDVVPFSLPFLHVRCLRRPHNRNRSGCPSLLLLLISILSSFLSHQLSTLFISLARVGLWGGGKEESDRKPPFLSHFPSTVLLRFVSLPREAGIVELVLSGFHLFRTITTVRQTMCLLEGSQFNGRLF